VRRVAAVSFLYGEWPESAPYLAGQYVRRLYDGVRRNTSFPVDFWVVTDTRNWDYVGRLFCGKVFYHSFLPVWWEGLRWNLKKVRAFDPELGLGIYDWVLLLDLDLVITGSLDEFFQPRDRMITCRGAYRDAIGGSVIGFDPNSEEPTGLVSYLKHNQRLIEQDTRGSERKFLAKAVSTCVIRQPGYWQDILPGKVLSYKVDGGFENGASIVRFHGSPRPHEVDHLEWMGKHWRGNGAH